MGLLAMDLLAGAAVPRESKFPADVDGVGRSREGLLSARAEHAGRVLEGGTSILTDKFLVLVQKVPGFIDGPATSRKGTLDDRSGAVVGAGSLGEGGVDEGGSLAVRADPFPGALDAALEGTLEVLTADGTSIGFLEDEAVELGEDVVQSKRMLDGLELAQDAIDFSIEDGLFGTGENCKKN